METGVVELDVVKIEIICERNPDVTIETPYNERYKLHEGLNIL